MIFYIWLDDERKVQVPFYVYNNNGTVWHAQTYDSCIRGIEIAKEYGDEIWIDFDHDLGTGKTGYDVAKYLVENQIPARYKIHSMNPVGRKNIEHLLKHYGYKYFQLIF